MSAAVSLTRAPGLPTWSYYTADWRATAVICDPCIEAFGEVSGRQEIAQGLDVLENWPTRTRARADALRRVPHRARAQRFLCSCSSLDGLAVDQMTIQAV